MNISSYVDFSKSTNLSTTKAMASRLGNAYDRQLRLLSYLGAGETDLVLVHGMDMRELWNPFISNAGCDLFAVFFYFFCKVSIETNSESMNRKVTWK